MDRRLLDRVVTELAVELTGGVVKKAHQPDERTLVLRIFSRAGEKRVIISTHPGFYRMHLTVARPENPAVPKRFCALLRARLTGARVAKIECLKGERIVHIVFEKRGVKEPGTPGTDEGACARLYTLVVELTGKSANAILVDSQLLVLDALKYFDAGTSGRGVAPGLRLVPLRPKEPQPEEPQPEEPEASTVDRVGDESWNEAADRFYTALVEEEAEERERSRLRRLINRARKKAARKERNLRLDKEAALEGAKEGRFGELLLANRAKIRRGAKSVEAIDYTVVPPVTVEVALDVKTGPQENIERYFKRARKAKRALSLLALRLPEAVQETGRLEELLRGLDAAVTKEGLAAFKEELVMTKFFGDKRKSSQRAVRAKSRANTGPDTGVERATGKGAARPEPFRRYTSTEGFTVLCGRSGAGNDQLVKKEAAPEDIWLHAKGVPGSHVLIKVAGRGKELTRRSVEEAAGLAAFYSKAKGAGLVEVIYTEARHVKKPRGAKPGSVTVREYRSLKVRPGEIAQ